MFEWGDLWAQTREYKTNIMSVIRVDIIYRSAPLGQTFA